jgi:hypothetical protein
VVGRPVPPLSDVGGGGLRGGGVGGGSGGGGSGGGGGRPAWDLFFLFYENVFTES